MAFTDNYYTNEHAKHAVWAPIVLLGLWGLARLLSGFGGLHRNRSTTAAPVTTDPAYRNNYAGRTEAGTVGTVDGAANVAPARRSGWEDSAHRTTKALRDAFIWIFSAWVLNYVVNGFTRGLMIFMWVTTALIIVWALLKKPLGKFADLLLPGILALVLFLFINAAVNVNYGRRLF